MFRILNIECKNNNYVWNSVVDRENAFYGQAVVDEDGYFEGLVTVIYSDVHIERFIFGSYKNDSISLYKLDPINKDVHTRYDGYLLKNSFPGNFTFGYGTDDVFITGDVTLEALLVDKKEFDIDIADDIMYRINNWKFSFFDNERSKKYEELALGIIREKDDEKIFKK